jgi:3-deoxy-manno-octulosonate cytidylyltransferase (CMP-KDO synthetase)
MSTLAVIPARLGSTRLPRKPLQLIAGRPMILRVWERVSALRIADHVVVATDSREVEEALSGSGATVVLTSPDHPSGTDRVAEVAAMRQYAGVSAVLNVQGDEPFVSREALTGALGQVLDSGFPLGTVAVRSAPDILNRPDVVKLVAADDGRAMYFSRAPVPWLREPEDAPLRDARVYQHVGVYAYTPEALVRWVALPQHPLERIERLEQLRPLAAGIPMGVALMDELPARGVDTMEDLEDANARWSSMNESLDYSDRHTTGRS